MTKTELDRAFEEFKRRSKFIREATYEGLFTETTEEQEARIKHLLKPANYVEFFDYYFGMNVPIPLADAPCADFHQSSYENLFKNPFAVQLRQWYRGAAKSIHTNVGNVTHLKENNELRFGLIVGQNSDHAGLLLADLQAHLESNERYIKDFDVQMSYGSWADGNFETMDGAYFKALGIDQPFRGLRKGAERVDFVSVDDVEDRKIAKNKERIKERGEKLTGDIGKSFGLHRGRMVIPNNYIVKGGLLDHVKNEMKTNPNLEVHTVNLRDEKGVPSWHQRITPEKADQIDASTDYYTSQREDYNNPIEKGKRFKEEWVKYEKLPPLEEFFYFVGYWDLSYKKTGDYKAFALLGVAHGKMYVLDVFCRQCETPVAVKWHYDKLIAWKLKGVNAHSFFDGTASQEIVHKPTFVQESMRRKIFEIPMADHTQSGDKHMRIDATLSNVFFNGTLVFSEALKGTADMEAALTQILSFEKGTTSPDDFPDALENAVKKAQIYCLDGSDMMETLAPTIVQRKRGGF